MFDSLKKKLKDIFSKAKDVVSPKSSEEEVKEEKPEEVSETKVSEIPKVSETKEVSKEEVKKSEPKGLFQNIVSKITEKELTETDIEKIMDNLKISLVENDVAFNTADTICEKVKSDLIGKKAKRDGIETFIKNSFKTALEDVMKQETISLEDKINEKYSKSEEPFTIAIIGFNGVGKTTTLAKLAKKLSSFNPVVAAGDTFRAASIEQLEEHSKKIGFKIVKHSYGSDSAAVFFDAKKHAKAIKSKVVIADTAGRSHKDSNLMDELKKVIRINNPDMKILVLDSLAGNDIYDQSKLFDEAVGVDAIILTKADVYSKGGSCISASHTTKKPILYIGTGQEYDDLEEFDYNRIISNILE